MVFIESSGKYLILAGFHILPLIIILSGSNVNKKGKFKCCGVCFETQIDKIAAKTQQSR